MASRVLALWCPDWPVVAAEIVEGIPAHTPVAVVSANRVIVCSDAARAEGVRRGLRKREAQSRCPQLTVVAADPARDTCAFEPIVAAVEELAPGVEVTRPGACALAARGPSRYFGGEERAAERIVEHVAQTCSVESQVGIAEGVFAAGLAARVGRIVPPGDTVRFLATLKVTVIDRPQLTDLLRRLGIRTLGEFAALPPPDVLARFGFDAAYAHRLAAGRDADPLAVRRPPPDLAVAETYDEPLDRVDVAAFAARALARRLHERLAAHGLACTRLGIEAVTVHGQELYRTWRHEGLLSTVAVADRLRWQLEGWLKNSRDMRILRLRLVPDGIVSQVALQQGLWGEAGEERDRAYRALIRVQGILGPEAVVTPVLDGGRSPVDRVRLVPWGDDRAAPARPGGVTGAPALAPSAARPPAPAPARPPAPAPARVPVTPGPVSARVPVTPGPVPARASETLGQAPARAPAKSAAARAPVWPGGVPAPAPATVLPRPLPAAVHAADGSPVWVTARLDVSAPPARITVDKDQPVEIAGWAGPWPVEERWWAPAETCRLVRFQVCLADGRALLLALRDGVWGVEASYD